MLALDQLQGYQPRTAAQQAAADAPFLAHMAGRILADRGLFLPTTPAHFASGGFHIGCHNFGLFVSDRCWFREVQVFNTPRKQTMPSTSPARSC